MFDSNGIEIDFDYIGTTVTDTGRKSNTFAGNNIRKDRSPYYCSDSNSFYGEVGFEVILFEFASDVQFVKWELKQSFNTIYDPKDFTLEGLTNDGNWHLLNGFEGFEFPNSGAVNEFDVVLISYPSSVPTLVPTADLTTSLPTKGPASSSNLRYHTLF